MAIVTGGRREERKMRDGNGNGGRRKKKVTPRRRKITAIERFDTKAFLLDEEGARTDYRTKAEMEADIAKRGVKVDIQFYFGSPLARLINENGKESRG
jgi:hypothetical protein